MRKVAMAACIAASLALASCCVFQGPRVEVDRGLLESSLRVNDTILVEYEEYVRNDKNLDVDDKGSRLVDLAAYRMLLRGRAGQYNRDHPVPAAGKIE